MLADVDIKAHSGCLDKEVHLPATAREELLRFIAAELPRWRDTPHRPVRDSEPPLTDQLCDHLNSAARLSIAWSHLQFRTEVPDEIHSGRKIDLAPKPCGATLVIEGRVHTRFDMLFPVECKRLPIPTEANRDQREYIISRYSSTGGIQRFKSGDHGAAHSFAAMIAYVQSHSAAFWLSRLNRWIARLTVPEGSEWKATEMLQLLKHDPAQGVSRLLSVHSRGESLGRIELHHLWLVMNLSAPTRAA